MTVGGEYMFNLQKLVDDKGKTIIPARYLKIQPISTQIALVHRSDKSVGFYDIATKKFRPVELGYGYLYGANKAPLPPTFILGTGPEDGLYNVCFIRADGSCGKTVKRLKGRFSAPLDKQDILKINSSFIINQQDSTNKRFSMTYDWSGQDISGPNPPAIGLSRTDVEPRKAKTNVSTSVNSILFRLDSPELKFGGLTTPLYWPADDQGSPAAAPPGFVGMFPIKVDNTPDHYGFVSVVQTAGVNTYYISDGIFSTKGTQAAQVLSTLSEQTMARDLYFDINEKENVQIAYRDDNGWYFLTDNRDKETLRARLEQNKTTPPSTNPVLAINGAEQAQKELEAVENERRAARDPTRGITEARERRKAAIARIQARGNTMRAYGDLCRKAYYFATTRSEIDARDFVSGYDQFEDGVCSFLPVNLYNSMVAAGNITETPSEPAPKSDWDLLFDELGAGAANSGQSPGPGATYSCYVSEGRRICGY